MEMAFKTEQILTIFGLEADLDPQYFRFENTKSVPVI